MIAIKDTYIDKNNKEFSLVKEYIYDGNEKSLGTLKKSTNISMIFQDICKKDLGYKIYSYEGELQSREGQEELIQNLHEFGKNIVNTEFPLGVVTYNNNVIGQAIPYYNESNTLAKELVNRNINPYSLLIEVYMAVKELYESGILYYDIHAKNIMVTNTKVRIIDFDDRYIEFTDNNKVYENKIINEMNRLIMYLPWRYRPGIYMPNINRVGNLNELYEELCFAEEQVNQSLQKRLKYRK